MTTLDSIIEGMRKETFSSQKIVSLLVEINLEFPFLLLDAVKEYYYNHFSQSPYTKKLFDLLYERKDVHEQLHFCVLAAQQRGQICLRSDGEKVVPEWEEIYTLRQKKKTIEEEVKRLVYGPDEKAYDLN